MYSRKNLNRNGKVRLQLYRPWVLTDALAIRLASVGLSGHSPDRSFRSFLTIKKRIIPRVQRGRYGRTRFAPTLENTTAECSAENI